jgi:WD40 repeat protein
LVVSGSRDGSIRLWKFETGDVLSKFMVHIDVFDIRITKNNERIVARGDKSLTGKLFIFEILNLEKTLAAKPEPHVARERTNMTLSRGATNVSIMSTGSEKELEDITE